MPPLLSEQLRAKRERKARQRDHLVVVVDHGRPVMDLWREFVAAHNRCIRVGWWYRTDVDRLRALLAAIRAGVPSNADERVAVDFAGRMLPRMLDVLTGMQVAKAVRVRVPAGCAEVETDEAPEPEGPGAQ